MTYHGALAGSRRLLSARSSPPPKETKIRVLLVIIVASLVFTAASGAATLSQLRHREKRQTTTIWSDTHTLIFFKHHRRLRVTRPGRKAIRFAKAELAWTRREIKETMAALHPKPVVNGPFPIDSCTAAILPREGGMNPHSQNPRSGAYGGPQALPGSKMASAGADWRDNIWTQIRWMVGYENANYGSPCGALAFWNAHGWY